MQIESDRIIIRDLEQNDVDSFINIASDGTLSDIFGDCTECSNWMGEWLKEAMDLYSIDNPYKEYLAYAIVDRKSNQVMGSVGCSAYEDICEIGITYFIGSKFRKQGFALEAATMFTHYFLTHYINVTRLIATIRTEHKASCKTIEKAGFVLEQQRMYKDINDAKEQEYNFYFFEKNMLFIRV